MLHGIFPSRAVQNRVGQSGSDRSVHCVMAAIVSYTPLDSVLRWPTWPYTRLPFNSHGVAWTAMECHGLK